MSFRRPKGGRRVVEPKAKNLNTSTNGIQILRFALDDKKKEFLRLTKKGSPLDNKKGSLLDDNKIKGNLNFN